jgi:hypothetical protein
MIVLIDCGEDMLFVPTWMITKSTNLKFVLPEETNSKSLPMVAPGKAWVTKCEISFYFYFTQAFGSFKNCK